MLFKPILFKIPPTIDLENCVTNSNLPPVSQNYVLEGGKAFDEWFFKNPKGGVFEYEQQKFKLTVAPEYLAAPKINHNLQIQELVKYYSTIKLPNISIRLAKGEMITDVAFFVDSHIQNIIANENKSICEPFINRLTNLKTILEYGKA